jgi:hypothetical protein
MSLLFENHPSSAAADRLRDTYAVSAELIADIIRETCRRFPSQSQTGKTARVERMIQCGAWTEAALALIDLELPQWQIRRLVYDDGEWHCAFSRQRELPDWLDQAIETRHADLALAILSAFVEAVRTISPASKTSVPAAPLALGGLYEPVCCDDFF